MREKGEIPSGRPSLTPECLESHNDTAVPIAEAVGGSVENFADMMNGKQRNLAVMIHIF